MLGIDFGIIGGAIVAIVLGYIMLRALYNNVAGKVAKSADYIADVALTSSASWAIENSKEVNTEELSKHKQQIKALLED